MTSSIKYGAINGFLFGALAEMTLRSVSIYESYMQTPLPPDVFIETVTYRFSWWYLPLLSTAFLTTASFLVHRYLSRYAKSIIWRWQVIAFVAALANCLYSVMIILYHWQSSEQSGLLGTEVLVHVISMDIRVLINTLPVLLAFNLIFALILQFRETRLP